ncbi:dihydrofolate reductase family protein [Nocardia wallacei]|uniref:dihydrofolate reductase family protein n=1 Tax=Nocardia wallacei TaxID=480035 RepID=UPI0024553D1B|nr:dihydrofolate reductase family protein [Nocardia wallacei]
MREVILQMMVSVDGMAEGPGRNLDWVDVVDPDLDNYLAELLDNVDAQIFGRTSYELLAQYWPDAERDPATPGDKMLAPKVNGLPKIVVSRREGDLAWTPATRIGDNLAEEVAALKKQPGRPLILFAGATTAREFMRLDLVDEFRLLVFPVLLGGGQPLFAEDDRRRHLRLIQTVPFAKSGVVLHRYRRQPA